MNQGDTINTEPTNETANAVPSSDLELGTRLTTVLELIGGRQKASLIAHRSKDQLWKWTRGAAEPPFRALAWLCLAAGVRMEWLATGDGPMLVSETAPDRQSQAVRPDIGKLIDALALIDQALALTHRTATREARAKLVAMAYDVLSEEETVIDALRRIMQAVETTTQGASHGQEG